MNDGFVCVKCGHENPPLSGGFRNHCRRCLYSLHVDDAVPGDRASDCGGQMMPIALDYSGKKGYIIVHRCVMCEKEMRNKSAADDSQDSIVGLSRFKNLVLDL